MADAQPMEEAIEEETQHPEDDIDKSPVDEEDKEVDSAEQDNVLQSESNLKAEKIQQNLQKCQKNIEECLDRLEDSEWNEYSIQRCIGPDHLKVKLVMHYERDRILSTCDQEVRESMWKFCYQVAGEDLQMSQSCDEMEKDTIDFLWSTLDFSRLLDINRSKYTQEIGIIEIEVYEKILDSLSKIQKELFEMLTELDSQSDALIVKIDNYIDNRTEQLKEEIEEHPEKARMLKKTTVKITTNIPLGIDLKRLPKKQSALLDHLLSDKDNVKSKGMFTIDEIQKRNQARQLIKDLKMGEQLKKLAKVAPQNWMKEMLKLSLLKKRKVSNFKNGPQINIHEKYRKTPKLNYRKNK